MAEPTDVFPPRDLPGRADDWGRKVQDRIVGVEEKAAAALQMAANMGRGQSGTNNTLSRQLRDLVGRESYSALDPAASLTWGTTSAAVAFGPTLTFTLSEPRVVSVTSNMVAGISGFADNGNSITITTYTALLIDSVARTDVAYGALSGGVSPSGIANGSFNNTAAIQARGLVTLDAGTHTVQGYISTRTVATTGAGYKTGFASVDRPSIFVDVLQPA